MVGTVIIAAILSVVGIEFFLPIILGCYFGLIITVFFLDFLTNYFLHKINLFERLDKRRINSL
jgi:hypothetical protein